MELTIEQTLQHGVAAHNVGKLEEAERLYRAILQSQPAHPDANHNLGLIAVSVNKAEAALPLFKTALEANPKIEQFWLSYIDALIKGQQFEIAEEVLAQGKKAVLFGEKVDALEAKLTLITKPEKPNLPKKKKSLLLAEKRKKLSERKKKNKGKRQRNPSHTELNCLLEHYQNARYDDAEKLAIPLTEQFPRHPFSWKVLGGLLRQTGRISESLVVNKKSVDIDPKDAEAHSNLGIALQELGKFEEAEASYRQALALKPGIPEVNYNLAITLKALGSLEEAEASYIHAIALKPAFAEAYSNLSITLKELGRLEEAELNCRKAIALKSNFAEAHSNLGIILKGLDRLEEAEASFTLALALKPGHAGALMGRGQTLFNKGEFEVALRDFDSCNTEDSRSRALVSLYKLERIEEIYERIATCSEIDDVNLRVAAFSSFISAKQKKDTANNFCKNPIDLLHFTNISTYLEDSTSFITEAIEELCNVKTIWEPNNKATQNGFQSRIDLFKNPLEKMSHLKSIIIDELDSYYLKFKNEPCSFIKQWPTEKNLVGWHVILKQQGHQIAHTHPSGWLSGVIYLKVVPSLEKNEGAIEFSLNGEHYSDVDSPNVMYQPKLGDIVFFPSSLHHRTVPFTTDTDRIIVSFDLKPKVPNH